MSTHICVFCDYDFPADQAKQVLAYQVCPSCIQGDLKDQFVSASKNEVDHPVKVANVALDINDFADVYPPELIAAYNKRIREEYAIPVGDRIYCTNYTAGDICGHLFDTRGMGTGPFPCSACSTQDNPIHMCKQCRTSFSGGPGSHTCGAPVNTLEGSTRGVEYQVCPNENCKREIGLHDGCNHITCKCGTHFCYVCGAFAPPGSGHFGYSPLCPTYGPVGGPMHTPPAVIAAPTPFNRLWHRLRQLMADHRAQLRPLAIAPELADPTVHALIELLAIEVDIYSMVLAENVIDRAEYLENHGWLFERVLALAQRVRPEDWDFAPQLFDIFASYTHAWDMVFPDQP